VFPRPTTDQPLASSFSQPSVNGSSSQAEDHAPRVVSQETPQQDTASARRRTPSVRLDTSASRFGLLYTEDEEILVNAAHAEMVKNNLDRHTAAQQVAAQLGRSVHGIKRKFNTLDKTSTSTTTAGPATLLGLDEQLWEAYTTPGNTQNGDLKPKVYQRLARRFGTRVAPVRERMNALKATRTRRGSK
jgi:hypothetical protein